jgi:hypothetical protein
MSLQRTPSFIPPFYDIDVLLDCGYSGLQAADNILNAICGAIEKRPPGGVLYFRPDSALLTAEVVVRDLYNFNMTMNSGFLASLGYGGGFTCFFRALRALRIIRHEKGLALAETVRNAMVANGAREPLRFDDDIREGADVDWDTELEGKWEPFWDAIEKAVKPLDDGWFSISHCYTSSHPQFDFDDPPLFYTVCAYLDANRDLLRSRKESPAA